MEENAFLRKGMDRKLYKASQCGNAKLLDEMLNERTVDIFQEVTPTGDTALHTAALHGHTQLAIKLISLASDDPEAGRQFLKTQNTDGNTALHVAAERGCTRIVKKLVAQDIGLTNVKNNGGETALFKASENGREYCVEYLLEYTPESEEMDRRADGQTPLHAAVSHLCTGVTAKLLDKRPALVEKGDVFQRTALHILAFVPLASVQSFPVPFRSQIRFWSINKIGKMLVDKKISLMYRVDTNGQSAVHLAAKVGNSPLVKVILSYGTDCAHISDEDGRTALHLAVEDASQIYKVSQHHLKDIISSLILTRLINCSDKSGQTALDIAIHKYEEDEKLFWSLLGCRVSCLILASY